MAAEIALAVASFVVSPLVGHVTMSVLATAKGERKGVLEEELRVFELKLASIRDVVGDAESKQVGNAGVNAWLRELKDIMYDAEDALDEYATAVAIRRTLSGIWIRIKTKYSCLVAVYKIKSVNQRLENIVNGIEKLGFLKLAESNHVDSKYLQRPQTTSLMDIDSHVIDREDAKSEIIELLTADATEYNNNPLLVLPIVGMGGIGKTTLAQLVFNDDSKVNKCFDLKIWICVSDEFDLEKLSRNIISSICGKEKKQEPQSLAISDLERLHNELVKLVQGKKILLVLDDAWNDGSSRWDQLLKPLKFAKCGSWVVVTTRKLGVVEAISKCLQPFCFKGPYFLRGLTKGGLWRIIERFAFANGDITSNYKELKEIGMEIVEKLKGSPLAAKTVGRVLSHSLTVSHWKKVSSSEIWELEQNGDDILPSLMLSYQHLGACLKQCVQFCSLFPKDHCFDMEMMVYLWMAHNFFQVESRTSLYESGEKLVDELLSWSFFQREMHTLKMHDLVHDLALLTSQDDHLQLAADNIPKEHPGTLRHLSLVKSSRCPVSSMVSNIPSSTQKLRTLLCLNLEDSFYNTRVLGEWCERLRCLRVLVLAWCKISELPKSISNLKHLRYLDLSHTDISKLPDSLTTLYNLQVLRLRGCRNLDNLPRGMRNLVNLKHLDRFYVGKKKKGCGIEELDNLNMLGGELGIMSLENVGSREDAGKAKLHEKVCLREMILEWDVSSGECKQPLDSEHAQAVLEALRPNSDLRVLRLEGYPGMKPPNWLSSLSSLEHLFIESCCRLESLPDMRGLASLQTLNIVYCDDLESLPDMGGLSSLQTLNIIYCNQLESLPDMRGLSSLRTLSLAGPSRLQSLPDMSGLSSLQTLNITGASRLQSLPGMRGLSSLQTLNIADCMELQSLPDIGWLSALQTLNIADCIELQSLPDMRGLSSLQTLNIESCHQLQSLSNMRGLSSLWTLNIVDCNQLQSLPDMSGLSSLQTLSIAYCHSLSSVQTLNIENCHQLQTFSYMAGLSPLRTLNNKKMISIEVPFGHERLLSIPTGYQSPLFSPGVEV